MHQHSHPSPYYMKERQKKLETILRFKIIAENFPNMRKETLKSGRTEHLIQAKPKEEHAETHINQTNKN